MVFTSSNPLNETRLVYMDAFSLAGGTSDFPLMEGETWEQKLPMRCNLARVGGNFYISLPLELYNLETINEYFDIRRFMTQYAGKLPGGHIFHDLSLVGDLAYRRQYFYIHTRTRIDTVFFAIDKMAPDGPVFTFLEGLRRTYSPNPRWIRFLDSFKMLMHWVLYSVKPISCILADGTCKEEPPIYSDELEFLTKRSDFDSPYPACPVTPHDRFQYLWDKAVYCSLPFHSAGNRKNKPHIATNAYAKYVLWYVEKRVIPYRDGTTLPVHLNKVQAAEYVAHSWLPWYPAVTLRRYVDTWDIRSRDFFPDGFIVPEELQRPRFQGVNNYLTVWSVTDPWDATHTFMPR